ncbi:Uncharacterised protein [Chryseobacterium balustinum]|uniref:Uncharacterized protein n=1 Tax=Chryseobacterium balustinum TaxID=246 RepID=A0AAX2IID1_9FLAO|nr:Uncharacterised protein [Chryseobacterium balustinum]
MLRSINPASPLLLKISPTIVANLASLVPLESVLQAIVILGVDGLFTVLVTIEVIGSSETIFFIGNSLYLNEPKYWSTILIVLSKSKSPTKTTAMLLGT